MNDEERIRLLNSGTTDNFELLDAAKKLRIPLRKIAFKNQLDVRLANGQFAITPQPGIYFLNMQDAGKGGTHWVGLFLANTNKGPKEYQHRAWYYDSYGVPPPEAVLRFVKRFGARILEYSKSQIQAINTNYCGQYVLDWAYYMTKTTNYQTDSSVRQPADVYKLRYLKYLKQFHTIREMSS